MPESSEYNRASFENCCKIKFLLYDPDEFINYLKKCLKFIKLATKAMGTILTMECKKSTAKVSTYSKV